MLSVTTSPHRKHTADDTRTVTADTLTLSVGTTKERDGGLPLSAGGHYKGTPSNKTVERAKKSQNDPQLNWNPHLQYGQLQTILEVFANTFYRFKLANELSLKLVFLYTSLWVDSNYNRLRYYYVTMFLHWPLMTTLPIFNRNSLIIELLRQAAIVALEKESYENQPSGNLCVSPPKIDPVLGGHTRITQQPLDRHRNRFLTRTNHGETVSGFQCLQRSPTRLLLVCLLITLNGREIVISSFQCDDVWCRLLEAAILEHTDRSAWLACWSNRCSKSGQLDEEGGVVVRDAFWPINMYKTRTYVWNFRLVMERLLFIRFEGRAPAMLAPAYC